MSTGQRINFEPVSSILAVQRKDFALADKTLAKPLGNANPLTDGEWMIINTAYQAVRAADVGSAGNEATQTSYLVFAEEGRWDVQAMSMAKVPLLFLHGYEGDTRIFDAAAALGSGAAITTVGQPLKVASITINGLVKTGLVGHGGAGDASPIVGRVTKLPANNGGRLRFISANSI